MRIVHGHRHYGAGSSEVRALDGVTIDFAPHRFTAVMGQSGSGKSTLLHCLAGLDRLTSGEVYLGDVELGALNRRQRAIVRRQHVGVVFQGFNLHAGLDVAHNIALPSLIAGHKPDAEWVDEVVGRLRLRELLHRRPAELSGGERQRAATARALAGRPTFVLADEPTGNLDRRAGRKLLDILHMAVDELGQSVILATHELSAACTADRVVVLGDGKVTDDIDHPTIDTLTTLTARATQPQQEARGGTATGGSGLP